MRPATSFHLDSEQVEMQILAQRQLR